MNAESLARALGGKRCGMQWLARCPAHEDRTPSLSLTDNGGLVLWRCHAGCSQLAVRDALAARGFRLSVGDARKPIRRAMLPSVPRLQINSDSAAAIWREACDPRGTLAEQYLNQRG